MKKTLMILFLLALVAPAVNAQKLELTTADKEEFKHRAVRMIELFTESLTVIPSFNPSTDERILRDKAIRNVLRLFTKDATMQLAYANGSFSNPIPMPSYLNSLTNYEARRELVHIDIIEFTVEEVEPHPTELGKYIVRFEFVQRFSKKKDYIPNPIQNEKFEQIAWDYVDITTKGGVGIIEKITTQSGTKWVMLLDDVEAKDIEVIED
ncbi:hypothetical protein [Zunongwangia profunda]|uniref:hypothetical protein n=1 Tax=Zunongwangia profunda TaxID=398743 RepID=UPI0030DDB0EB